MTETDGVAELVQRIQSRAQDIVADCLKRLPADDVMRRLRWCDANHSAVTLRPDGEDYEIHWGGERIAIVPKRILTDPDVTTFAITGELPTVPDDLSELTE
ncbi:hypothetical protein HDA40_006106 [Hamadaea flava]|uniref:Halobacterial output domain-containing protein n=1 Tax=Hamadaea flava TaxID=1742688 RepID=A0ABV8LU97_9ACTN|nr:hypothetical protein [Hamadaea flava]MCP2327599.1 hypothetical protein [Hamadaea flava]